MYRLEHNAFTEEYRSYVERSILTSPYLGNSPLGPEFVKTGGYSVVFRRSALREVLAEFGYMSDFIDKAVFPKSNAFYINPLVMNEGSRVGAHVDCRLLLSQNVRIIPTLVSIFYVSADDDAEGGELVLNIGSVNEITLRPKRNDLLYFRGNIIHGVSPLVNAHPRVSLVCEQYNLTEALLDSFPTCQVIQEERIAPQV